MQLFFFVFLQPRPFPLPLLVPSYWLSEAVVQLLPSTSETEAPRESLHVKVFVSTSDSGSDQAAAVRQLAHMLEQDERTLFIGQWCLQHQLHLCVLRQLKRAQSAGRYVSRWSQVVHTWRSSGPKIRAGFQKLWGEATADRVARTPPPAPLRGRWGAIHDVEGRLLLCTREQLRTCSRLRIGGPATLQKLPLEIPPDP